MSTYELWTLEEIRQKVRNLIGIQGVNEMSDDEINGKINRYLRYKFPLEVKPKELKTYYELTLTVDADSMPLDSTFYDSYTTLDSQAWISKEAIPTPIPTSFAAGTLFDEISVYMNSNLFYNAWPMSKTHTSGVPSAILIDDGKITLRKVPKLAYGLKCRAWKRPDLLTAGTSPLIGEWGPVLATGAALDILEDQSDQEAIGLVSALHKQYISDVNSIGIAWLGNQRPVPRF